MHDTSLHAQHTTLTDCESERLHLSGKIQGFGALIVVRLSDWIITHASDNADSFLGSGIDQCLGTDVRTAGFWSSGWADRIPQTHGERTELMHGPWVFTFIRSGDYLLIECEPIGPVSPPIPIHQLHRSLIRPPNTADELTAYQETLVQHLLAVTGMNRVMVYRFRDDWSGEVITEATDRPLGSYMGLRFPAGDIPAIARKLYEQNPIRTIPDVEGPEYAIRSLIPEAPDLSFSDLRSVSPMHQMYLRNMGVAASLSLPVLIGGQLWGLVVGHSYAGPCLLSHDQRHCAVLLANAYALGLANYRAAESLRLVDSVDRRVHAALQPMLQADHPFDAFHNCAHALQQLMEADAVAVAMEDRAALAGEGLNLDALADFDRWFVEEYEDYLLMSHRLTEFGVQSFAVATLFAGVLAVRAWSAQRGWLRFYWFRLSESQQITWAGHPDKPREAASAALSPRRSFEKWVEIRHGSSREWTSAHRLSALRVRAVAGRSL